MAAKWEPPKLDLGVERYSAFKSWKQRWKDYAIVTKLNDESAEYKCSMLRYTFSDETQKIYETLGLTDDEEKDSEAIINKLETFAKGTVNETMERHTFNSRNQKDGEPFDDFLTEIKILSKNCNFCQTCHDGLIRDRIVGGIRDPSLRQKLLSDDKLNLKKTEDACRAREKAREGAKLFDNQQPSKDDEEVDELRRYNRNNSNNNRGRGGGNSSNRGGRTGGGDTRQSQPKCKFCTHNHKWGKANCHAWGKPCDACGEPNHFKGSEVCAKTTTPTTVRNVNEEGRGANEGNVDYLFLSQVEAEGEDNSHHFVLDISDDEDEYFSCTEGDAPDDVETTAETKTRRRRRRKTKKAAPRAIVKDDEEERQNEHVSLAAIEETDAADNDDEEQYFSCDEEIPESVPKRRRTRRRGPRKPRQRQQCEEEALICPLANTGEPDGGVSWEIHMPGVNGQIHFKIDTGADVTVIPEEELEKLGLDHKDICPTTKKLFGPGKQRLKCLGYVKTRFTWGDITDVQIVYICRGIKRALLGKPAIRRLKIVELNLMLPYRVFNLRITEGFWVGEI